MMQIALYTGEREDLRALLELADEPGPLASYIHKGEVLAASEVGTVVGLALLAPAGPDALEIKNLAVRVDRQGTGIGRALVEACVAHCKGRGVRRIVVATAAADVDNLRFYQRVGFRMLRIQRDAFTAATGYSDDDRIDDIPLRDQVWFDREL
jgi:ribosomal protein S18 acetylase RimI-like enzyme